MPNLSTVAGLEVAATLKEARQFLRKFGIDESKYSDDEVLEKIAKIQGIKAENVQVLSRGVATDQITAALNRIPKGFIGQFVFERPIDIKRAEMLGFSVFLDEEAARES